MREKLAIVGTGIAGMGAAHLLQSKYELSIFEKNNYVGGHTNTIEVKESGGPVYFDTGFMVFNYVTYPNLCKLFEDIKAPVKKTSMSFSVQHIPSGLEYCGSGLSGLFAQRKNMFSIRYIKMLIDIANFNKTSVKALEDGRFENISLREFVSEFGFGEDMLWKYLIPMSSAVWSTPMEKMLDFPAMTLVRFFKNHGFLGLNTQHQWYTISNGSQSYRELLIDPFRQNIFTNTPVKSIRRSGGKAILTFHNGDEKQFDKVILACHADEAYAMLEQPSLKEKELLPVFRYEKNLTTVHCDEAVMPKNRRVWSSWNYRIEESDGKLVPSTIYWMNSLQGVSKHKNYFVSINAAKGSIDPGKILRQINYEHPLFDLEAIKAQNFLDALNSDGPVYFCGSYFKYGFHEDAYASAVKLCNKL